MSHVLPAPVAASDAVYAMLQDRDCVIVAVARTPVGAETERRTLFASDCSNPL